MTIEELYQQAQLLSSEERRRLALLLFAPTALQTIDTEPALGERLKAIRARIVADESPLLDALELEAEIAERRGER